MSLQRRTPLQRKTPLRAKTWWNPERKPLRLRSKKTAKVYREQRVPLVAALLEQRPVCELRWDERCTGRSTEVDEIVGRGRGGSILDETNLQTACHHCHAMKTAHPAEARQRGLERHSWQREAS